MGTSPTAEVTVVGGSNLKIAIGCMAQSEQGSLFVVHQVAGPVDGLATSYLTSECEQEQDSGEYFEYDEQDEDQPHQPNYQQQQPIQHVIPLQIRVPIMVPKQYRANYAIYYCASRRLQSIPEAPSEMSDAISVTPDESIAPSSARNSRIIESAAGLMGGVRTQEEVLALLNAAENCGALVDNAALLREQYSKQWCDSITPHKLAIRQLLNSPDLPFIDGPDSGSTLQLWTSSQNDLTSISANANANGNGNNGGLSIPQEEASTVPRGEGQQQKPLGKSPRFVKKLVGFACCCTPVSSKS